MRRLRDNDGLPSGGILAGRVCAVLVLALVLGCQQNGRDVLSPGHEEVDSNGHNDQRAAHDRGIPSATEVDDVDVLLDLSEYDTFVLAGTGGSVLCKGSNCSLLGNDRGRTCSTYSCFSPDGSVEYVDCTFVERLDVMDCLFQPRSSRHPYARV